MPLRQCTFSGCNIAVEVPHNHRGSPRCDAHAKPTSNTPKKAFNHHYYNGRHIYSSQRWVKLRNLYVTKQPLCEEHLKLGLIVPGGEVDHIVEISDGGEIWEESNLQNLCHSCHNAKTARIAAKRRRKKKNNGFGSLSDF